MSSKLNIKAIIIDHINTFKSSEDIVNKKDSLKKWDLFVFFFLPVVFSVILVLVPTIRFSTDIVNSLLTIFSIFTALLFNLLLLIFDVTQKKSKDESLSPKQQIFRTFLKHIFANISFLILTSIMLLILLLVKVFDFGLALDNNIFRIFSNLFNLFVFALIINFIFTLIMILKRIHILLTKEFEIK